jgi:hypothetical protein
MPIVRWFVGIGNGFAGDPTDVLREPAGPLPVIRDKQNPAHVAFRHFREREIQPGEQILIVVMRRARDAAGNRSHKTGRFRAREQPDIIRAHAVQAIQFAHEPFASAGPPGIAEVTAVPHIRAHVKIRFAAQFESSVAHTHKFIRASAQTSASGRDHRQCECRGFDECAAGSAW